MFAADPAFFTTDKTSIRTSALSVVHALLATETPAQPDAAPTLLGAEGEGGEAPGPPQRDKKMEPKFQLGTSLQEQDQL